MQRFLIVAAAAAAMACAVPAGAQFINPGSASKQVTPLDRKQPVAFTADHFEYNRETGIVTASGHVEAWQNDHILRADTVTFDRNTNVAAAKGNVVLVEPDGQVLFADYAELTQGMREAALKGMRAILAENGKLAANGARRVDGQVNELSKVVYTTCNLCKTDPSKPPLWQLRALTATQDLEHKRIEYHDAVLDMFGIPVGYFPYFSHPDPSVRRASGFLVPSIGSSSHIGTFAAVPYFWAIDPNQDLTLTPEVTTESGEQLSLDYRRRFNNGRLNIETGGAVDQGKPQAFVFAQGAFSYDDTYRYGFNVNRSTDINYLRDFRIQNYSSVLTSNAFVEGFGTGAYTKLDVLAYQGLATTINNSFLPYVLPRYEYSYFGEPDALGGRLRVDTTDFNVVRNIGNNTQRAALSLDWQRPFAGDLGEQYKLTLHSDQAAYIASDLNQQPVFGTTANRELVRAQPTIAAEMRWPFIRDGGSGGSQLVEPIVQLIEAPQAGSFLQRNIPNEDSLDFEFTDANLFSINRFPGLDRFEGGARANVGVQGSWTIGGASVDGLVGQSYKEHVDRSVPLLSGLDKHVSDVVARLTVTPSSYFDLTGRTRVDPRSASIRFIDSVASAGVPVLRVSAGYLYSSTNSYFLYDQAPVANANTVYPASYFIPRNEVTVSAASQYGAYKVSGYVRDDVHLKRLVSVGAHATYEDECFIFDASLAKRYTSINNDTGGTTLLFQITLKTVGQFGFHG